MTHKGSGAGEEIALPGFSSCPREDVALTSPARSAASCRLVQQQSRNSVKDGSGQGGRQPELNVPPQDAQQPTHGSAMLLVQEAPAGGRNSLLASGGAEDSDVLQGNESSDMLVLDDAAPGSSNDVAPAGSARRTVRGAEDSINTSDVLTSNARRTASTTLEAIMLSQPLNPLVPVRPQKIERRR